MKIEICTRIRRHIKYKIIAARSTAIYLVIILRILIVGASAIVVYEITAFVEDIWSDNIIIIDQLIREINIEPIGSGVISMNFYIPPSG